MGDLGRKILERQRKREGKGSKRRTRENKRKKRKIKGNKRRKQRTKMEEFPSIRPVLTDVGRNWQQFQEHLSVPFGLVHSLLSLFRTVQNTGELVLEEVYFSSFKQLPVCPAAPRERKSPGPECQEA